MIRALPLLMLTTLLPACENDKGLVEWNHDDSGDPRPESGDPDSEAPEETGEPHSDEHTDEPEETGEPVEGSLADATKVWAEERKADAGRHMDWGDLDGDGREDALVGEMWADSYQGGAFVLTGPVTASGSFGDLGLELSGGSGAFEAGRSLGVADADGDGYDDALIGSPDATAWDAVVFLGPITESMQFREADLRAFCDDAVECGHGSDLADVTGDGLADAIIGAGEERNGGSMTGSIYLLFGPLPDEEEPDLREDADVELEGAVAGYETGRVVVAGQDLDGDGVGDLMVTSRDDSGARGGNVYVVLSPITASLSLADADGTLVSASAAGYAGEALAMGDLDGDGLADAVVGAYGAGGGSGLVSVIPGPAEGEQSVDEAALTITGADDEAAGTALAARDVDGDEVAELLVGAGTNRESGRGAGAAYLFRGPLEGALDSEDAALRLLGEESRDGAGQGVGFADLDADGWPDLLIGAPTASTGASDAGAIYLVSP